MWTAENAVVSTGEASASVKHRHSSVAAHSTGVSPGVDQVWYLQVGRPEPGMVRPGGPPKIIAGCHPLAFVLVFIISARQQ